ncbi:MAG: hypothetical protein IAE82_12910, partial [Opitutaceae bacterium]|nr:hypothetical protein [Opitutaceae bacterium]
MLHPNGGRDLGACSEIAGWLDVDTRRRHARVRAGHRDRAPRWPHEPRTGLANPTEIMRLTAAVLLAFFAGANWVPRAVAEAGYVLIDLGTLGGAGSVATAVNDAGVVVGISDIPNGDDRGFVWDGGRATTLDPAGGVISQAYGINDAGI